MRCNGMPATLDLNGGFIGHLRSPGYLRPGLLQSRVNGLQVTVFHVVGDVFKLSAVRTAP